MLTDLSKVKNGTRVRAIFGVGCGEKSGKVYGHVRSRFGDFLRIKFDDFTFDSLHSFTDHGIGWYLENQAGNYWIPRKAGNP